jgi:hypothetical protein
MRIFFIAGCAERGEGPAFTSKKPINKAVGTLKYLTFIRHRESTGFSITSDSCSS